MAQSKGCLAAVRFYVMGTNGLLLLVGASLLAVGIWAYTDADSFMRKFELETLAIPIGLMVLGAFVLCVSFLGCCGAFCENRCFLGLFIFVLVIIMLAQVGLGIAAAVWHGDVPQILDDAWHQSSEETRHDIQTEFDCCGYRDQNDYPAGNCTGDGCQPILEKDLENSLTALAVTALVLAGVQIMGLICSSFLCGGLGKLKKQKEDEERLLAAKGASVAYRV